MWLSVSMMTLARVAEISPWFALVYSFAFFTTLVLLITDSLLSSEDAASLDFLLAHVMLQLIIAKFLAFATIFCQNRDFAALMFFSGTFDSELFF